MKFTTPNLSKYTNAFSYGDSLRPTRDWLILLALGFLLIVASLAWNLWAFKKVVDGESLGDTQAIPAPAAARLERVMTYFEKRDAEAARYRTEYQFVDPSLRAGTVSAPAVTPEEEPVATTTATTTAQ